MENLNTSEIEIIEQYEPLIYKISKKFYNVEISDLYQAGMIGLIKAHRNYDVNQNVDFIYFAYKYIYIRSYI